MLHEEHARAIKFYQENDKNAFETSSDDNEGEVEHAQHEGGGPLDMKKSSVTETIDRLKAKIKK